MSTALLLRWISGKPCVVNKDGGDFVHEQKSGVSVLSSKDIDAFYGARKFLILRPQLG